MRKLSTALITIQIHGANFHFRPPGVRELPAFMGLTERMKPSDREPTLEDMAVTNAAFLGLLWEAGPGAPSDAGALDAATMRPPEGAAASPGALLTFGAAVLDELSAAGVGFGALQVLTIHLTREMMGATQIQEAVKAADFTDRR